MAATRGRRVAVWAGAAGVLALVATGCGSRPRSVEDCWLYELEHGDEESQKTAAERLGEMRSIGAVPLLVRYIARELSRKVEEDRSSRETVWRKPRMAPEAVAEDGTRVQFYAVDVRFSPPFGIEAPLGVYHDSEGQKELDRAEGKRVRENWVVLDLLLGDLELDRQRLIDWLREVTGGYAVWCKPNFIAVNRRRGGIRVNATEELHERVQWVSSALTVDPTAPGILAARTAVMLVGKPATPALARDRDDRDLSVRTTAALLLCDLENGWLARQEVD